MVRGAPPAEGDAAVAGALPVDRQVPVVGEGGAVLSAGQPTGYPQLSPQLWVIPSTRGCSHVGAHNHHGVFGEVSVVLLSGGGVCERPPAGVKSAEIGLGEDARYPSVPENPRSKRALPGVSTAGRSRIGAKTHLSGFREVQIFFATPGSQLVTRPKRVRCAFDMA